MRWRHNWSGAIQRCLLGAALALASMAAQANGFSVGRVEVVFAEEGWKEVPLPDTAQSYGGDKWGALSVQVKLYVRAARDGSEPVYVMVSANSHGLGGGRSGYMTYSPDCKSDDELYREGNSGFSLRFAQCLLVAPRYTTESILQSLAPQVKPLRESGAVPMASAVYAVWSRHAISTGSFVDVRVFTANPIDSDQSADVEGLPDGVPSAHVTWGRQLSDAVKSSVYSLSGRLSIPPIRTVPPAPRGPTFQG